MLILCPNCESIMSEGDRCPECNHNDGDGDCDCPYCEQNREWEGWESDWENETGE